MDNKGEPLRKSLIQQVLRRPDVFEVSGTILWFHAGNVRDAFD